MKLSPLSFTQHSVDHPEGDSNCLNSQLWHACAGPLVSLPSAGTHVVYFPQGHSEQVSASTNQEINAQVPNYPTLSPQLICRLHNVTMQADIETDEVYAQMTLQPLNPQEQKEISFLPADLGAPNKQPTIYFCKTLTASDTSTHGGFSVPRRAAEKVFPPLDFSLQPPAQELIARDLHNNEWKFRHIFRGQPKRHLLTTGWSIFVSAKRLVAGDSVLFLWNDENQLLLGIRRANRQQTVMPSSVLSSDSMHMGLLAAAAHAASTNTRFTIFYNPRASPCEFVIPLAKYMKAVYHTQVSVGMRFRMLFETEESSIRRHMGTITGMCDLDPACWPNSHWRSVKVGWDESATGDKQRRVSLWEIEPLTTFPMHPSPFLLRSKRPWSFSFPSIGMKPDGIGLRSSLMWPVVDIGNQGMQFFDQGMNVVPWMQSRPSSSMLGLQNNIYPATVAMPDLQILEPSRQQILSSMLQFQQPQPIQPQMPRTFNPLQQQLLHQIDSQRVLVPHSTMQSILPVHHDFPELNIKPVAVNSSSPLHSVFGSPEASDLTALSSSDWPVKRVALNPLVSSQIDQLELSSASLIDNPVSLPPFPGSGDPQNNFLFGVNMDSSSSFVLPDGLSTLQVGSDVENATVDFALSGFMSSSSGVDYSLNAEEGLLPSSNNSGPVNPPNRTFVKVYKSGSFGRSLDITKFSSYSELRNELAQMFGPEGQLEDHLRSGWQLVFVDRENDVLLLGDDPWPEFVNSVWCIKILSPEEVDEMGRLRVELLNSVPHQKGRCDGYARNMNAAGIPSVDTLDI